MHGKSVSTGKWTIEKSLIVSTDCNHYYLFKNYLQLQFIQLQFTITIYSITIYSITIYNYNFLSPKISVVRLFHT